MDGYLLDVEGDLNRIPERRFSQKAFQKVRAGIPKIFKRREGVIK